jgi:hypothetical protein
LPFKRPITATHYLNRQEGDRFIKENQLISLTAIVEELNICVSSISEIVVGLDYQKRCVLGGCNVMQLQWREQGCKHVSNYLLAAKVRVMIFCTALSQGTRVGCLTLSARPPFQNFSTPCILNVNNTGAKQGSIMK